MKKYLFILLFLITSSLIFGQNVYFINQWGECIYNGRVFQSDSVSGSADVNYYIQEIGAFWIVDEYAARNQYPDGHWENWRLHQFETHIQLTEAGTYHIQGRVHVQLDLSGQNDYYMYSNILYFSVEDHYAPFIPQNFSAVFTGQHPVISWTGDTQADLASYTIAKMVVGETGWADVATASSSATQWTDETVTKPASKFDPTYTIKYKIKAADINNNISAYSPEQAVTGTTNYLWKTSNGTNNEGIISYKLFSNYPNPFNPSTQIEFQIPKDGFVNLTVYNSLGQKVTELVKNTLGKGKYTVEFNAANLPSGIYIYKIQSGNFSDVKKMILTK